MINYKEARAGNLVMYDNRLFQIESISRSLPCLNTDEFGIGVVDWNNIQPISLTPEILEKCGLKNGNSELDRNVFYSTNKHLAQFSVNISGSFGIYVGVFIALRSVHLEYLHQLQNLYFALTNEELNYTP